MGTYSQQADKARQQAARCTTAAGRRRATNRAASLDHLAAAEQNTAAQALALAARNPYPYSRKG